MITKREQYVREFSAHHSSVFLLVVKLQTLEEVFVASLLLILFTLAVNRQKFVELQHLLAPLFCPAQLLYGGVCGIQVKGPQDVAKVDGVDDVGAIGVVNGEGEFCLCSISKGVLA